MNAAQGIAGLLRRDPPSLGTCGFSDARAFGDTQRDRDREQEPTCESHVLDHPEASAAAHE
jgi:hypothetical protein